MVFGTARAVKSHRTGRRRKKGGSRLPVAPWIVITLVCVLVASSLVAGFVMLLRAGCSGTPYEVSVAADPSIVGALEDAARAWEERSPQVDGECVGVAVNEVGAVEASRSLTGEWDTKSLGPRPIGWVPDSAVWPEWVTGTEVTADYFSSDPVLLGQSRTVLGVPEPVAQELGWLGGQPPSWSEVLDAVGDGAVTLAAANPRMSTEGLQSMLNASSDGVGGVDAEAMRRYSEAMDAGWVGDTAGDLFSMLLESEDPESAAVVFTALDHQVEEFNSDSELSWSMAAISPAGDGLDAAFPYVVLDGAGWVSASDARIASMFGDFLAGERGGRVLADAGVGPVEEGAAPVSGEVVRDAVRQWHAMRRDLNVLIVVDQSESGQEVVEFDGESVSAADAALRLSVELVGELGSTSRAGLWEFGVNAGGSDHWREVSAPVEMSADNREALEQQLWGLSDGVLYTGGTPLFDTAAAAVDYMSERAVEGAENVVVVLTNGGVDQVSAPTVEQAADALAESSQGRSVSLYTVGFGGADSGNLTMLAEATGGAYIPAPTSGGLLSQLRENLVN